MKLFRKSLFVSVALLALFLSHGFARAQQGYIGDDEIVIEGEVYKRTETEFHKISPQDQGAPPSAADEGIYPQQNPYPSLDGQTVSPTVLCEDTSQSRCVSIGTAKGVAIGEPVYGDPYNGVSLWQKVSYNGKTYYVPLDELDSGYTDQIIYSTGSGTGTNNYIYQKPVSGQDVLSDVQIDGISLTDYFKGAQERSLLNKKSFAENILYTISPISGLSNSALKVETEFNEFQKTSFYQSLHNWGNKAGDYFLKNDNTQIRLSSHLIKGTVSSLTGMIGGIISMVAHPTETAIGFANLVGYVWNNPKDAGQMAWDSIKNFGTESFSSPEKFSENLGRLIPDIAAIAFSGGSLNVAKTSVSVTAKAGQVSRIAGLTSEASKLSRTANYVSKLGNAMGNVKSGFKLLASNKAGKASLIPSINPIESIGTWLKRRNMTPSARQYLENHIDEIESVRKSYEPVKQVLDKKLNLISLKTGVKVDHANIKTAERMVEKMFTSSKYGKNVKKLTDMVRSRFVVDDFKSARVIYRKLKKEFGKPIESVTDRLKAGSEGTSTGYRSIVGNWQIEGKTVEIQIVPKEIFDVGKKTHKLYGTSRSLKAQKTIIQDSKKLETITSKIKKIDEKTTSINTKAWNNFQTRVDNLRKGITTSNSKKWYEFWK